MAQWKNKEEYLKWKKEKGTSSSRADSPLTVKKEVTPPAVTAEKSLPLAIGLNFVLPGAGYMYMGRFLLGIIAFLFIILLVLSTPLITASSVWIGMNVAMAIDMFILNSKRQKKIAEATLTKCPFCAELIKKEAKVCRYCHKELPGAT